MVHLQTSIKADSWEKSITISLVEKYITCLFCLIKSNMSMNIASGLEF